jgi:hypothetical protein
MRPTRVNSSLSPSRRILALGWLALYLVSTIGIPIPSLAASKATGPTLAACGCSLEAEREGTCCCSPKSLGAVSCCSKKIVPQKGSSPRESRQAAASSSKRTVILAFAARQCQGLADVWLSVDIALPLVPPTDALRLDPAGSTLSFQPVLWVVFADPPVPPPRLGAPSLA